MIVLGIDPGKTGAWAIAQGTKAGVWLAACNTFAQTMFDGEECLDGFKLHYQWAEWAPELCVFEKVHAQPKFGSKGSFNFGRAAGQAMSVVQMMRVPVDLVTPQAWKAHYGLIKAEKEASIALAEQLLPDRDGIEFGKNHNKAEAALLALYGIRTRLC